MKNISITGKFSVILAALALTVCIVMGFGWSGMNKIRDQSERTIRESVMRRIIANRVLASSSDVAVGLRDLILSNDDSTNKPILEEINLNFEKVEKSFEDLTPLMTPEIKNLVEGAEADFKKWKEANRGVIDLAMLNKDAESYKLSQTQSLPIRNQMTHKMKDIIEITKNDMDNSLKENEYVYERTRTTMMLMGLIGLAFSMALSFLVISSINRNVNLSIDSLKDTALQVSAAAQQVAGSSHSLSEATTQQAASLEETSASIEEMTSMVSRNADASKESQAIANSSVAKAEKGQEVLAIMLKSMNEINNSNLEIVRQTNENNNQISEIVSVINEIGNKTKVINEIVFQTKLLSFNASVEAARAGEHGKGFAVVAEEVGNLAQMSGNAAMDISKLLDGSIKKVEAIVHDSKSKMERITVASTAKVAEGTQIALDCRIVFDDIVVGIGQISKMSNSITSASDEQARGIAEINRAITQLDEVTQLNAGSSEEAASASEALSNQADYMKTVVDRLSVMLKGSRSQQSVAKTSSGAASVVKSKPNAANVIQLGNKRAKSTIKTSMIKSIAVGSSLTPSEDDERFNDN